jgi:hypothetical protein
MKAKVKLKIEAAKIEFVRRKKNNHTVTRAFPTKLLCMLYVPMTLKTSSIISLLYTAKCKNVHLHYRTMFNTFSFSMQLTGKMNAKLWGPSNPHNHKVLTLSEERKFLTESGWFQTQDLLQRTIFTKQWIY